MTENVYEKARQVLKERGWKRGNPWTTGGLCILGACAAAEDTNPVRWDRYAAENPNVVSTLAAVIGEQFPAHPQCEDLVDFVYEFNDFTAGSADDVDLVLDKAARQWDETHGGVA